jgi:hypothetical protein
MKATLIKSENSYILKDGLNHVLGIDDKKLKDRLECPYLLSKQNCDEIFGVVDVEKLAEKEFDRPYIVDMGTDITPAYQDGFKIGFNKAMELSKDKVFTLGDMKKAFELGYDASADTYMTERKEKEFEILIHQPTEIEVEIEMEYVGKCNGNNNNGCFQDSSGHNCKCFNKQPKLDSQGNLILKKI